MVWVHAGTGTQFIGEGFLISHNSDPYNLYPILA